MKDLSLLRGACCVLLIALSCGCRRSSDPEAETPPAPPHPLASSGQVVVQARVAASDRIDIVVANGTKAPLEVRRNLRIEQERDEEWHVLEGVGPVWIRDDCDPIDGVLYPAGLAQQCLTLEAETVIEVQPWLGTVGDAQCACEECAPVPGGRYRVVLHDCHGGRFESEPFTLRQREEDEEPADRGSPAPRGDSPSR